VEIVRTRRSATFLLAIAVNFDARTPSVFQPDGDVTVTKTARMELMRRIAPQFPVPIINLTVLKEILIRLQNVLKRVNCVMATRTAWMVPMKKQPALKVCVLHWDVNLSVGVLWKGESAFVHKEKRWQMTAGPVLTVTSAKSGNFVTRNARIQLEVTNVPVWRVMR
jgi:hypothetical protein